VASTYPDIKVGAIPVVAGTLYKFACEVQVGDRIIYPSKVDRKINLGMIDSDYIFDARGGLAPNIRKVKWSKQYDRTDFSQSALYEIGSAVTLFRSRITLKNF